MALRFAIVRMDSQTKRVPLDPNCPWCPEDALCAVCFKKIEDARRAELAKPEGR